jgi:lipoate-protein ligase A
MYAVVLSFQQRPELKDIGRAHAFVLGRLATAIQPSLSALGRAACDGTSDLVYIPTTSPSSGRKFSGNSMRAKRTHLLYHGTLLYDFDLSLVETCLRMPPRQPGYRAERQHLDFITNLPIGREGLLDAVNAAWPTSGELNDWPQERVAKLVAERFSRDEWNFEFA